MLPIRSSYNISQDILKKPFYFPVKCGNFGFAELLLNNCCNANKMYLDIILGVVMYL